MTEDKLIPADAVRRLIKRALRGASAYNFILNQIPTHGMATSKMCANVDRLIDAEFAADGLTSTHVHVWRAGWGSLQAEYCHARLSEERERLDPCAYEKVGAKGLK